MSAKPYSLDQTPAAAEFVPTTQDELRRYLAENHSGARHAIAPVGGRTALDFGYPLAKPATTLALTGLNRVVDFPARDMTITVEAGIRIDRLVEVLAAERQRLPIDIAQSSRATLGGAVATNTSGPRRFALGTFRDYVIGLTAVTAEGRLFHSGGRVVKNVAGYDLCKLLVGSLGTLAVVTQLTLKLKPIPETSVLVWASFRNPAELEAAVADLLTSQTRPAAIDSANPAACIAIAVEARIDLPTGWYLLFVGFEGSPREVDWEIESLRREISARHPQDLQVVRDAQADRLWSALTEFPTSADEPLAFQANVLPSRVAEFEQRASQSQITLLARAADGIMIGKLSDDVASLAQAQEILAPLSALAAECRGNLTVLHCDGSWKVSLPRLSSPAAFPLMRKLKLAFDPHDLLNPGRIFPVSQSAADTLLPVDNL